MSEAWDARYQTFLAWKSRFDRLSDAGGADVVARIGEARLARWATLLDDDDVGIIVEMLREAK